MVCAEAFRAPGAGPGGGGGVEEMDLFCGAGTPDGEAIILGPAHHPVPFSESPKSETGRRLPAVEEGEQMLNAHSRKLETQHPSAHPLSHWGPPLALTLSPVVGRGGQKVSPQQLLGQRTAQRTATGTCVSALSCVLPLFEDPGACWANPGKPLSLSGLPSGKWFTQGPSGFNR